MKKNLFLLLLWFPIFVFAASESKRTVINLNGSWQFDQTVNAFPPIKFTRTIPVPGLVHLAEPKIEDYDKFFKRPDKVVAKDQHNLYNIDYTPRYSWYRKMVFIPKELEGKEGMITVKKSQYVTRIYVNGTDMGTSIACYTPVEFPVTNALKYGAENEILIKVGDRVWLPAEAAGGTDKEKEHYLPGIWDDVQLSFTGKVRINRLLVLPSVAGKKVTVKAQLRNLILAQIFVGDAMKDSATLDVSIAEKLTGNVVAGKSVRVSTKRDNLTEIVMDIPVAFTLPAQTGGYLLVAEFTPEHGTPILSRRYLRVGKAAQYFYFNLSPNNK